MRSDRSPTPPYGSVPGPAAATQQRGAGRCEIARERDRPAVHARSTSSERARRRTSAGPDLEVSRAGILQNLVVQPPIGRRLAEWGVLLLGLLQAFGLLAGLLAFRLDPFEGARSFSSEFVVEVGYLRMVSYSLATGRREGVPECRFESRSRGSSPSRSASRCSSSATPPRAGSPPTGRPRCRASQRVYESLGPGSSGLPS
jgi:hypothetical protein